MRNLEPVLIGPLLPRLKPECDSLKTVSTAPRPISPSTSQSALILVSNPHHSASMSLSSSSPIRETSQEVDQQLAILQLPYPTIVGVPTDRLLELKLFHHYLQMAPLTDQPYHFDNPRAGQHGIWKEWIANLAVSDHILMDAVLGFSASHLRALNPFDRDISQASYKYMLRAIIGHAEQVRRGVDGQNVESLFAASIFMGLYSSMNPSGQVYGPPLHVRIPAE
jgi:hypothetical protein